MYTTISILLLLQPAAGPLLPPAPQPYSSPYRLVQAPQPLLQEAPPALDELAPGPVPHDSPAPGSGRVPRYNSAPEPVHAPPAYLPQPEPAYTAPNPPAPPMTPPAYVPVSEESVYDFPVSNAFREGVPYHDCEDESGTYGCFGWCCCCCWGWAERSTGDMHPHYAYHPTDHGYYYFAPYNYSKIAEHQELAIRWGGDARWPYLTDSLSRLYDSAPVDPTYLDTTPVTSSQGITRPRLPSLESLLKPNHYDLDRH